MLIKIMDILAGLKMTIVSGVFLLCAIICMVSGIESPIDPAWGAVIISGIPLFYLALDRLIFEKWVSSALLITIAMIASLAIGEIFAAAEVAWIMALGALLEDWTVERAKKGLKNLIELTPQTGRLIYEKNGKKQEKIISVDEIKIDDEVTIDDKLLENTDIKKISKVKVKGNIYPEGNNFSVNLNIKCILTLVCSISLKDVEYNIDINVNEIIGENDDILEENNKIINNSIDLIPIIWQNIILEVPLKVVSPDIEVKNINGDGWRFITDEEVVEKEIDPRLEKLKEFLGE